MHFFFPYHWPKTRRVTCDKLGDRAIKHLLYSVIAKYNDLSRRSIVCLSFRYQQIIDLLATDKSRYFATPHPITVNFHSMHVSHFSLDERAQHVTCK